MDDRPRNLREMLAEAKDSSELMIDLAYAALYFGDPDMAEEVGGLEETLSELIQDMRGICILAVRNPREAEGMSSVLQVISAIERMANDAVDIARIVTHKVGIPAELVADLSQAEEISHRVLVSEGSHLAHRPLSAHELPVQTGMRVMAVRRERQWITDVGGDLIVMPGDACSCAGRRRHHPPAGARRRRQMDAAGRHRRSVRHRSGSGGRRPRRDEGHLRGRRRARLLGARAWRSGSGRRGAPARGSPRRNEGPTRALGAAGRSGKPDPSPLRGLLQLAQAAEDIGDQAQAMVWLIEQDEDVHPILGLALGDSDEVVVQVPVGADSEADGRTLAELQLNIEPGFTVLAIRRGGGYRYRPGGRVRLLAGDEVIASGPDEGRDS